MERVKSQFFNKVEVALDAMNCGSGLLGDLYRLSEMSDQLFNREAKAIFDSNFSKCLRCGAIFPSNRRLDISIRFSN